MRTFTVVEIASGTVQAYERFAAGVEAVMTLGLVTPPSVEYSSFTSASVPALVQVMVRVSPTAHVSPPLGAVRARAPRILKFAGDVEVTAVSLLRVILTLTVVEIAAGTVQAQLPPAAGVEGVMDWMSAAKLSRGDSSFMAARV